MCLFFFLLLLMKIDLGSDSDYVNFSVFIFETNLI